MKAQYLPEFQEFLISKRFVQEKTAPFYAYWVSRFLKFANENEDLPSLDIKRDKFLGALSAQEVIADWQAKQAETAVRIYLEHFWKNGRAENEQHQKAELVTLADIINKVRECLRIKHYSYRTERSYIDWIRRFYNYVIGARKRDISKEKLCSQDIREYLSFLAVRQKVASSTQNQAFNALLFLFRNVLAIEAGDLKKTVRAKRRQSLPVVLSIAEVKNLFKHAQGKELLMMQLLYGAGMRLMELIRLRVQDIDFADNLLIVRSGKGDKDRSAILPESIKQKLSLHLEQVKAVHQNDLRNGNGGVYLPNALEYKYPNAGRQWRWQYVFPSANLSVDPRSGKIRRHHIGEKSIQNAVRKAAEKAGINKHVTVHTLRHSFATHLLMSGVNIREIQELLGHKNIETTMVYTHILRNMANMPKSPLDCLYK